VGVGDEWLEIDFPEEEERMLVGRDPDKGLTTESEGESKSGSPDIWSVRVTSEMDDIDSESEEERDSISCCFCFLVDD